MDGDLIDPKGQDTTRSDSDVGPSTDSPQKDTGASSPEDAGATSSLTNETVVHILPCNIDYTGAVDGKQFAPQPIVSGSITKTSNSNNDQDDQPSAVEAVAVRGHGLLAQAPPIAIPPQVAVGHVWEVQQGVGSADDGTDVPTLTHESALSFQYMQEWHHEHLPEALGLTRSRVQEAVEWCSLAQSLHAPLLVDEE